MSVRGGSITNILRLVPIDFVTFPSFRATSAVLLASALWQVPYLRYPGLILNILILVATPLHSSHFMTDAVGSMILAAISIASAASVLNKAQRSYKQRPFSALAPDLAGAYAK
jgi:hypothetical protein